MLDGISCSSDAADLITRSVGAAGITDAVAMIPVCVLHQMPFTTTVRLTSSRLFCVETILETLHPLPLCWCILHVGKFLFYRRSFYTAVTILDKGSSEPLLQLQMTAFAAAELQC